VQNAKNLAVADRARKVAVSVYRLTSAFPHVERYGLTSQMRRAAVSIGSNIAEGCGRRGNRELLQYLYFAMGSASELQFQCDLATDLQLADADAIAGTAHEVDRLKAMLSRLIAYLRETPDR